MSRRAMPQAESSYRPAFVTAVALMLVVGGLIFFKSPFQATPVESAARPRLALRATMTLRPQSSPTTVAVNVAGVSEPVVAAIAILVTPTSSPIVAPTSAATLPSSTVVPTPISVAATVGPAHVGNTSGDGVYLRHTPLLSDRWIAWPDHSLLTVLGPRAVGDGQSWTQVRDSRNDVGWIPSQYVVP